LAEDEASGMAPALFEQLAASRRAARMKKGLWFAAERLPELRAVYRDLDIEPEIDPPASRAARDWTRDAAIVELLRGRLAIAGPTTAAALAGELAIGEGDVDTALLSLE